MVWSGFSTSAPACAKCGVPGVLVEDADAFACLACAVWLDPECEDDKCLLCLERPRLARALFSRVRRVQRKREPVMPYANKRLKDQASKVRYAYHLAKHPVGKASALEVESVRQFCAACGRESAWLRMSNGVEGCAECALRAMRVS